MIWEFLVGHGKKCSQPINFWEAWISYMLREYKFLVRCCQKCSWAKGFRIFVRIDESAWFVACRYRFEKQKVIWEFLVRHGQKNLQIVELGIS